MGQYPLNVIGLLYLDADPDRVDGRLNQNLFIFIASNVHWIQHNFRGRPGLSARNTTRSKRGVLECAVLGGGGSVLCLYFGDVVPFHDLGREVFEAQRCSERGADAA
jgi:hypothetical protein